MQYETMGLLFKWKGGAYIDVFVLGEEYPRATINVWDYEKNRPTIPYDRVSFIAECEDWLEGE